MVQYMCIHSTGARAAAPRAPAVAASGCRLQAASCRRQAAGYMLLTTRLALVAPVDALEQLGESLLLGSERVTELPDELALLHSIY